MYDPSDEGGTQSPLGKESAETGYAPQGGPDVLAVDGLTVEFRTLRGTVRATRDVSLSIARGEIVGLVGESGSGKSITALSLLGLVPAPGRVVAGAIHFQGCDLLGLSEVEMSRLRGRRIAYVSQTPRAALNPSFHVGAQLEVTLKACAPGLDARARAERARQLLASLGFAEPERVLASFPHQLSGGMCQRICIAMALAGSPDLLIADEPTTALDVAVQAQILALLRRLNRELGLAILIVSHDLALIGAIAHRVVVLYGGEVQESGDVATVLAAPTHPYTRALLNSIPTPGAPTRRLAYIRGVPAPVPADARGCRFAERCEIPVSVCRAETPALRPAGPGVSARCHRLFETVAR